MSLSSVIFMRPTATALGAMTPRSLVEALQGIYKDRRLLPNKARRAGLDLGDQGTTSIYVIVWAALQ